MSNITVPSKLDVMDKFESLMQVSVSGESVYIRTKETIEEFFRSSNISSADKANALSSILGSLAGSITSAAMQSAIQWASTERELALRKLQMGKEFEVLEADKAIKEAQKTKLDYESIATQSETIRMLGTPTVAQGKVLGLEDSGKVWQDIKVAEQQETNMTKEALLLDSRLKESHAAIHKTVADTVANYGSWTYALTESGMPTAPSRVTTGITPLVDTQRVIAEEQAKGYAYNAWSNAVTSSAGMIGTALASDQAVPPELISTFQSIVTKLGNVVEPTIP